MSRMRGAFTAAAGTAFALAILAVVTRDGPARWVFGILWGASAVCFGYQAWARE